MPAVDVAVSNAVVDCLRAMIFVAEDEVRARAISRCEPNKTRQILNVAHFGSEVVKTSFYITGGVKGKGDAHHCKVYLTPGR